MPQHILGPSAAALLICALAPVATSANASTSHRAASDQPASAAAHHQFLLIAHGGAANDGFGSSVAVSKGLAVVAAPYRKVHGHRYAGAAYVFVKPKSGWGHAKVTAVLTMTTPRTKAGFGYAVAIAGNTIAVGAPGVSSGTNNRQGEVFTFTKPAGGWSRAHHPTGQLFPSDRTSGDLFGAAIAGSGNTFVVGAPTHVVGQHRQQGAAYVFARPAGGWKRHTVQRAELTASDGLADTLLGYSVAISGNNVVAGAPFVRVGSTVNAGAAYLFTKPRTGGWRNEGDAAKFTIRHPAASQYLGSSVAVTGSTVAVGAPHTTVGRNEDQGASYVFVRPTSGWHDAHQNATLTVSPGVKKAYFGLGLAASGRRIVGAAFGLLSVFSPGRGSWHGTMHQQAQLSGAGPLDYIGKAAAMSGSTTIAGAPTQTVGRHKNQGAAYIFVR